MTQCLQVLASALVPMRPLPQPLVNWVSNRPNQWQARSTRPTRPPQTASVLPLSPRQINHMGPMIPTRFLRPCLMVIAATLVQQAPAAHAYVALMAGQSARPLNGTFNTVPVLHSNQPEEVFGPGILVNTAPGRAIATETRQSLNNATYTFNGDFGLHVHHKYFPENASRLGGRYVRGKLTIATIVINPGSRPVTLEMERGAIRNSFEAPYQGNHLMGVKPLGRRPWNTGPGDATSVIMLRGELDPKMPNNLVIPPYSRRVLFHTRLPARGIANGLLRGRSDGPFQMAVVAAEDPQTDADLFAVLDHSMLAPGRIYLNMLSKIQRGQVFSRVGGVAIGDEYQASLVHDLSTGSLHVPFTSTNRHTFGTREVQVNPLASRMLDSSLDNVGTYGVRFDVDLNLKGNGPYELVMSHPTANGRQFTAFRGSIGIRTKEGYNDVHVGMRSGESLSLATLNLVPGVNNPVRVSMVYPADATPGHVLSVVPSYQLAQLREREERIALARAASAEAARQRAIPKAPPTLAAPAPARPPAGRTATTPPPAPAARPAPLPPRPAAAPRFLPPLMPAWIRPLPAIPLPLLNQVPGESSSDGTQTVLLGRYREAAESQQRFLREMMGR
jgi:hypothetical protein